MHEIAAAIWCYQAAPGAALRTPDASAQLSREVQKKDRRCGLERTRPEAFGRIPAEAQAMGKPVIATRHGGAMETVLDHETGWLVPPGDPHALVQAIAAALSLPEEQRAGMAARAREHIARRFSLEVMQQRTLEVYREALATRCEAVVHASLPLAG